jgi:uncharacterized membrane protein
MSVDELAAVDEPVTGTERLISRVLRGGVLISLGLVVVGTAITFAHHRDYLTDSSQLDALTGDGAVFPRSLGDVGRGLAKLQGRAVVMLGLLVLIATPVMRVAVSIMAFARQRDRTFVGITVVVLCLLMTSFVLGRAGG